MASDPLEAARQIAAGVEDRVDCGCVNGLCFVNIFSFGIFTTTSQRTPDARKHRIGKLAYLIEGSKELRTMHGVPLRLVVDGEPFDFNSLMVLIFNGETAGGFPIGARIVRQGRIVRLSAARKTEFLPVDLFHDSIFGRWYSEECPSSAGTLHRHRVAGR